MNATITPADFIRVLGDGEEAASQLADLLGLERTKWSHSANRMVPVAEPELTLDYEWTCGAELRVWDAEVLGWLVSEEYLLVCLSSQEAGREGWALINIDLMDTDDIEEAVREFAEEAGDGPSGNGTVVTGDFRYVASVFSDMEPA